MEPCKEVVRKALRLHAANPASVLNYITTYMIDMPDYGENAKYSLFEQNVAIAEWVRAEARVIDASPPWPRHSAGSSFFAELYVRVSSAPINGAQVYS